MDFAVLYMSRFYKKHPELLIELYKNNKRQMWSRAAQIAQEAASNPQIQTAATLVTGAVAWKAIDVWDSYKQEAIAEKDREAENLRHAANIEAENKRHADEISMRKAELKKNNNN